MGPLREQCVLTIEDVGSPRHVFTPPNVLGSPFRNTMLQAESYLNDCAEALTPGDSDVEMEP